MLYRVQPVSIVEEKIIDHSIIWLNFDFVREAKETGFLTTPPKYLQEYVAKKIRLRDIPINQIAVFELCLVKPASVIYLVESYERMKTMFRGGK
mgnify:CR=1 FL=1